MPGSRDRPGHPDVPAQPVPDDMPGRLRPVSPRQNAPPKPDLLDQAGPADRLPAHDEPAPWSRADLRKRLECLPAGHPSSLRNDLSRDKPPGPLDLLPARAADGEQGCTREAAGTPADGRDHPDRGADEPKRDYWSEVPRFLREWAEHVRDWPAERVAAAVDRSRDPAGSWRGDGNQYLSPEQHAQAKDVIARVQRAEETLTKHMAEAERTNTCGGRLEGTQFRLKGEERLKEKIAEKIEHEPSRTRAEAKS